MRPVVETPRLARCSSAPEVLEARRRKFGVPHRVLDVAVSEVSLQCPRVVPSVCQGVTTGMPEHVWVRLEPKPSLVSRSLGHAREPCGGEGRSAFRGEHEGRLRLLLPL